MKATDVIAYNIACAIDAADEWSTSDLVPTATERSALRAVSRRLIEVRSAVKAGRANPSAAMRDAHRIITRARISSDLRDSILTALEHGV